MASIVEATENPGDLNALETELRAAVTEAPAAGKPPAKQTQQDPQPDADANLPEKLRGKSREEIASMYTNLQSAYGSMANDLGQQRKLTDRLLDLKRDRDLNRNTPEPVKVKTQELLDDPTAAIERIVQARLAQQADEFNQRQSQTDATLAAQAFMSKHPDYMEFANDQDFVNWVQSSVYRRNAGARAASGDWVAADELLSEYKERRAAAKTVVPDPDKDEGLEAARQVGMERGSAPGANSGPGKKPGKIYRRADLIRLKLERPHVYEDEAFQQEILKAYAEGRVK